MNMLVAAPAILQPNAALPLQETLSLKRNVTFQHALARISHAINMSFAVQLGTVTEWR